MTRQQKPLTVTTDSGFNYTWVPPKTKLELTREFYAAKKCLDRRRIAAEARSSGYKQLAEEMEIDIFTNAHIVKQHALFYYDDNYNGE